MYTPIFVFLREEYKFYSFYTTYNSSRLKILINFIDFSSGSLGRVSCTACGEQINIHKTGSVRKHPELRVLVCKVSDQL